MTPSQSGLIVGPCHAEILIQSQKKKMEKSSSADCRSMPASKFNNFLDLYTQRKRITYPGPLIMQFDQIGQCAHVTFVRIGYLVNVFMQDRLRRFPALRLQIDIGCVICSPLEIIGGLGLSTRLIVSFQP
jgi:hypothetical protein